MSTMPDVSQPPQLKSMLRYAFQHTSPKNRRGGVTCPRNVIFKELTMTIYRQSA